MYSGYTTFVREESTWTISIWQPQWMERCKKYCADSMVVIFAPLPFHPVCACIYPSRTTKFVSVAILLLYGVVPRGYSPRVREVVRELELTLRWPSPMNNLHHFQLVLLWSESYTMYFYHCNLLGFDISSRGLPERKLYTLESVAHTLLLFAVETYIDKGTPLG